MEEASVRHLPGRAALAICVLLAAAVLAVWIPARHGDAAAAVPSHLNILSAQIVETPPIDPDSAATRGVSVLIELQGAPDCASATEPLGYGILIDSDRKSSTGAKILGDVNFGADARISAECSGSDLVSPGRSVTVTTDGVTGYTTVEIQTTVGELPSVHFRWAPYAEEGSAFYRVKGPIWSEWFISEMRGQ